MTLFGAFVIGIIGSVIYTQTKKLIYRFEIDDPLDICEIHGFCGIWSILAVGLLDQDQGLLYSGNTEMILIQIIGIAAYLFWSTILSFVFFYTLKQNDKLRIDPIYEIIGLDFLKNNSNGQQSNDINRLIFNTRLH